MIKEFIAEELCEQKLGGIKADTFRRNKSKYIKDLEEDHNISYGKRGRFVTYILEDTIRIVSQKEKQDKEFVDILGFNIGDKDIELMKFILKSMLDKKIVPVQEEIVLHAKKLGITKKRGTVGNYIASLKKNNIILEPAQVPVWIENPIRRRDGTKLNLTRKYDKETGEVFPSYCKTIVNYIFFDFDKDAVDSQREKVSPLVHKAIEAAFNNLWPEALENQIYPLYAQNHAPEFIEGKRQRLQGTIIQDIGTTFGMKYLVRIEEPIINPEIKQRLKEYFYQVT
ncbi:hypothetical protein SAMN04487975_107132 [Planococcus glaciei]|uniref:hypothetical protein n=1 Tax=Planococcus glaciei TaxID=459472 RepID=UPI00088DB6FF|nr:hypothetical protein [Planococcus glaciei]SDH74002.1 hypothetical protein SAMN04487975_107132 [Planococcus glaciei]